MRQFAAAVLCRPALLKAVRGFAMDVLMKPEEAPLYWQDDGGEDEEDQGKPLARRPVGGFAFLSFRLRTILLTGYYSLRPLQRTFKYSPRPTPPPRHDGLARLADWRESTSPSSLVDRLRRRLVSNLTHLPSRHYRDGHPYRTAQLPSRPALLPLPLPP